MTAEVQTERKVMKNKKLQVLEEKINKWNSQVLGTPQSNSQSPQKTSPVSGTAVGPQKQSMVYNMQSNQFK